MISSRRPSGSSRLLAEELVKELETMKSKNGKLTALTSTNRIEAVDTVKNLQEMYDVLEEEQSGGRSLEEFILKYVRAVDVRNKLEELLGIEKKSERPHDAQADAANAANGTDATADAATATAKRWQTGTAKKAIGDPLHRQRPAKQA